MTHALVPGRRYDFRSSWYWRKLRRRILARNPRCHWCGGVAEQVDHVQPVSRGGARYDEANLVPSCGRCNRRRGDRGSVPKTQRTVFQYPGTQYRSPMRIYTHNPRGPLIHGDYGRKAPDAGD